MEQKKTAQPASEEIEEDEQEPDEKHEDTVGENDQHEHIQSKTAVFSRPFVRVKKQATQMSSRRTMEKKKSRTLTLAQLAQGFLNNTIPYAPVEQHINTGSYGNAPVSVIGKRGGAMSPEQVRIMNYIRKIEDVFLNELRINSHNYIKIMKNNYCIPCKMTLSFSLDLEGHITYLSVGESCGNAELDNFIVSIFREASSGFPPVPQAMAHDPLSFNYILTLA
jgi:hypothetical protein